MLATKNHMTISEYLLSFARQYMPNRTYTNEPNEETIRALKESREGKGEIFESTEDFWISMGMKPNVSS